MSKSIESYYPKRPESTKLVQATIDGELVIAVDKYRKDNDLTWNELMTALFQRLYDEEID